MCKRIKKQKLLPTETWSVSADIGGTLRVRGSLITSLFVSLVSKCASCLGHKEVKVGGESDFNTWMSFSVTSSS